MGLYARRLTNRENTPEIVQTERPPLVVCALLLNGHDRIPHEPEHGSAEARA